MMEKQNNIKVLVVDDNPTVHELFKLFLNTLGCQATYVFDGEDAVEALKSQDFDICFMDIVMPKLSGIEAANIIRNKLNKSLPIIAVTAYESSENKDACLDAGMNDFIGKPFDMNLIKEQIEKFAS